MSLAAPAPLPKPRTLPETVRRRKILDAARRLLVRNGYRDVSLDDVARHADVAKGTLYLYFKDKEDLLGAVLEDLTGRLAQRLEKVPACDGSADALRRLAEAHFVFVERYRDFFTQLVPSQRLVSSKMGRTVNERFYKHLEHLAISWIRPCISKGLLRAHEPELGAMYFLSLIRMFMIRKFLSGSRAPLKRSARQLVLLFMNGLGSPRRRRGGRR